VDLPTPITRPAGARRRRLGYGAGLVLLLAIAVPAVAALIASQHSFEVERERGDRRVAGVFNLALGNVSISEAPRGVLFKAEVESDDEELKPTFDVQRRDGTVHLELGFASGSRSTGVSWRNFRNRGSNTWNLYFDTRTPLDLRFDLGLSESDLDLTGFRVERLEISAGMATTRLAFDEPNPVVMERLSIDAGAARFTGEQLGNARFRQLSFKGGAGSFSLDFTGASLPHGARADIDVGVSRLRIRLPEDKAVVLHAPDSWLARVDVPVGYISQGGGIWHSARVRNPTDAFQLHINAGVGRVTCETVASQ